MALIIEDGTGVTGANSFVTVAEAQSFASDRGVTLDDESEVEVFAIKAIDYLLSLEPRYKGTKTYPELYLPFPRSGLMIAGSLVSDEYIPTEIKMAQCALILSQSAGTDVLPDTEAGLPVIRERVDVLETEYAAPVGISGWQMPRLRLAMAYLAPLLRSGGRVTTVRV